MWSELANFDWGYLFVGKWMLIIWISISRIFDHVSAVIHMVMVPTKCITYVHYTNKHRIISSDVLIDVFTKSA